MIYFNYDNNKFRNLNIVDEFLHGWCFVLQSYLFNCLHGSECYEIFEKTPETNGKYWNDHQIIKYKQFYIDVVGIYESEEELIEFYKKELCKNNKWCVSKMDCYIAKTTPQDVSWATPDTLPYKVSEYIGNVVVQTLNNLNK